MIVDVRRIVFVAALVGLGAIGWSMLHEDAELESRAAELACRGRGCTASLKARKRDLFGWTFTFTTYGEAIWAIDVTCSRGLWIVGEYRCDVAGFDNTPDRRLDVPR